METLSHIAQYIGAGICIGAGALGAALGVGYAAGKAVEGCMRQPAASDEILKTMLVGQAVAESSAIFALVVALMLMFSEYTHTGIVSAGILLGAGISMGFGAVGPAYGGGFAAGAACWGVARHPSVSKVIMRVMLIGQATASSTAIYSLVVSLLLIGMVR